MLCTSLFPVLRFNNFSNEISWHVHHSLLVSYIFVYIWFSIVFAVGLRKVNWLRKVDISYLLDWEYPVQYTIFGWICGFVVHFMWNNHTDKYEIEGSTENEIAGKITKQVRSRIYAHFDESKFITMTLELPTENRIDPGFNALKYYTIEDWTESLSLRLVELFAHSNRTHLIRETV